MLKSWKAGHLWPGLTEKDVSASSGQNSIAGQNRETRHGTNATQSEMSVNCCGIVLAQTLHVFFSVCWSHDTSWVLPGVRWPRNWRKQGGRNISPAFFCFFGPMLEMNIYHKAIQYIHQASYIYDVLWCVLWHICSVAANLAALMWIFSRNCGELSFSVQSSTWNRQCYAAVRVAHRVGNVSGVQIKPSPVTDMQKAH